MTATRERRGTLDGGVQVPQVGPRVLPVGGDPRTLSLSQIR